MLNQTSGLADSGFAEMRLPGWPKSPATLAERVTSLLAARPAGVPGYTFLYFNPNYDVLACLRSSVVGLTMQALRSAIPLSGQALAQGQLDAFGQSVLLDEATAFSAAPEAP